MIALGGSRNLRLWVNGEKTFNSVVARPGANLIDHLVRLDRPLTAEDRIEVIACSAMPDLQLSVALSLWSE